MTHNYFLKCPVCQTVTRMRTPIGYVPKTPVRVHCGKCDTLLTGEFFIDNNKLRIKFTPLNCEEVLQQSFDFFGEASGEMLCNKVIACHAEGEDIALLPMGRVSPVFDFMSSIPEPARIRFINYACYCISLVDNWDQSRIKYDLYLNKKKDLLFEKYAEETNKLLCEKDSDLGALQLAFRSLLYQLGGFFKILDLEKILTQINYHFSHMKPEQLRTYLSRLRENDRLSLAQNKVFKIMYDFVRVSTNLIPAIGVLYYTEPDHIDKEQLGISTCSFEDIKSFYQDTYESLIDCCDIIVGLDNIENRGNFDTFKTNMTLEGFRKQPKGARIHGLTEPEFFVQIFNLPTVSSSLRNAIGHSDYVYNGAKQTISYKEKAGNSTVLTTYLIDIALECCNMMRSTLVLAFIVYNLMRYDMRKDSEPMPMHPMLYKNVRTQSFCPCGSKRKYKQCCKGIIDQQTYTSEMLDYPMKAEFTWKAPEDWIKKLQK